MQKENVRCTEVQMLIRRPAGEVFEALINPEITKNFWFTKGNGRLEVGKEVIWQWEMYNASVKAIAKEIVFNNRIVFEWGEPGRTVEITFTPLNDDSTYVIINESGYNATGDELLAMIKDSTGGFTTVLDGLKAFLEHGINLNLIADKFPKEITKHGS